MMHGRGKSDSAIVAVKPVNKAVPTAAELVEPRAGAKGNACQQSTCRAQDRVSVSQALERIRQAAAAAWRYAPEARAVCIYVDVRICAGCALQVRSTQSSEMTVAVKRSEQPRTESCVVGRQRPRGRRRSAPVEGIVGALSFFVVAWTKQVDPFALPLQHALAALMLCDGVETCKNQPILGRICIEAH